MKITKFGHSCLLVEEGEARILIDPGSWSTGHTDLTDLNALLITHEHGDHCDIESIKIIAARNASMRIFTNSGVGEKLKEAGIAYELLEDGQKIDIQGVIVEAFGREHAEIYKTITRPHNTGYMIAERFFHPGDSVTNIPPKPVEILALSVVAPWCKLSEVLDYAEAVKPKACIPVHDAIVKDTKSPFHKHPGNILPPLGIQFVIPEHGKPMEF